MPARTATPPPLSPRQHAILQSVVTFMDEHGYAPTLREIQGALGISSISVVAHHLDVVEARGYLRRVPGTSRSIVLLPAARRVTR